jgi:hypothetical protein
MWPAPEGARATTTTTPGSALPAALLQIGSRSAGRDTGGGGGLDEYEYEYEYEYQVLRRLRIAGAGGEHPHGLLHAPQLLRGEFFSEPLAGRQGRRRGL